MDTLPKTPQNMFAYSFVSEHSKIFLKRKNCLFRGGGWPNPTPPPLADESA